MKRGHSLFETLEDRRLFALVPGTIQAEDFDNGGEGVAYHDLTLENQGSSTYRDTAVDLQATPDTGGGVQVSHTKAGEWLHYTVDVATTGTYKFEARVSNKSAGGKFRLKIDGQDAGSITVTNTGSWNSFATLSKTGVALSAGTHVVRIEMETNASSGYVGNFNWFRFTSETQQPPPVGIPVPGTIQAEDFDSGAEGIAYHDLTPENQGGSTYRGNTGVDLQSTPDTGGGVQVSHTKAGEWLNYTINVAQSGTYDFQARVSNKSAGGKFRVEIDGVSIGSLTVTNTGSWNTFATLTKSGINLTAGTHVMKIVMETNSSNGSVGNFNWFKLTQQSPPQPSEFDINWTSGKASPVKRYEAPTLVIDGKIWAFGGWSIWDAPAETMRGTKRVDVYDPATNTWSLRTNLPHVLTHTSVIHDGDSIYFVGGAVGDDPGAVTDQIWRYSISQNQWFDAGFDLPIPTASMGTALIGRTLHVFGGFGVDRLIDTSAHWAINLDNTAAGWQSMAAMPDPRHHFGTTTLNGKVYVFGGEHDHDSALPTQDNAAHVYDPDTNSWTTLANMPGSFSHIEPSTFVYDGKIMIGGGKTLDRKALDGILIYDPVADSYEQVDIFPKGLTAPIFRFVNGKFYLIGGESTPGGVQSTTYIGTLV